MYVPRSIILAVLLVAALGSGWLLHAVLVQASDSRPASAMLAAEPALASQVPPAGANPPAINLTVVTGNTSGSGQVALTPASLAGDGATEPVVGVAAPPPGDPPAAPSSPAGDSDRPGPFQQESATTSSAAPPLVAQPEPGPFIGVTAPLRQATFGPVSQTSNWSGKAAPGSAIDYGRIPGLQPVSGSGGGLATTLDIRAGSGQRDSAPAPIDDSSRDTGQLVLPPASSPSETNEATSSGATNSREPGNRRAPQAQAGQPAGITVNMFGTEILVASDGAIVFIGDGGSLNANTGDPAAGGAAVVASTGSAVTAGFDAGEASGAVAAATPAAEAASLMPASSTAEGSSLVPVNAVPAASTPAPVMAETGLQHASGSLFGVIPTAVPGTRSVAISGFEDHSVSVAGNDQIVTYDDSNVFINRDGLINANTGDTDSSGLNVVDATYSTVRSGNSGDAEGGGDEEEEEEEDDEEEDEDEEDDEDELTVTTNAVSASSPLPQNTGYSTVTDEGATTAVGDTTFVIGADGFDDVSIRSSGDRNIVTYDDSNVVIGGAGPVNAQIGDSDTGGAVVMGVHHSLIEAGCEGDLCYPDTLGRPGLD